jgi:uncharacterized protein YukE
MVYTDPIPANYDSSSINVDPGGLNSCSDAISAQVQDIANYLGNINTALSNLTLSWVGQASDSASTYNTEWANAVQALFGTQNDASTGALNILMSGLSSAAQNYSASETAIANMFNSYAGAFPAISASTASMSVDYSPGSSPSSSSSSPSTGPIKDSPSSPDASGTDMYHTTSVNES